MIFSKKRLRVFAGPNGSGKSTVKSVINSNLLGHYLNPDDIEKEVKRDGYYSIRKLNISTSTEEIITFFQRHPLIKRTAEKSLISSIKYADNDFINFSGIDFNSYLSAVLTDFLRHKLIHSGQSFTFETVMSSSDKIKTLETAHQSGFRNYLYYVATEDPTINLERIRHRVRSGGHSVPEEKVVERYYRSLDLLLEAIKRTDRAYIFDNSGDNILWIAEITGGYQLDLKTQKIPQWFSDYVLDKL